MKKYCWILTLIFTIQFAQAQITITKNDFAIAGDTMRLSNATGFVINNLDSTGPNHLWDYSNLIALNQTVDTFVAVSSAPFLYQLYFNNQFLYPQTKATVATKINVPALPPGAPLTLSNAYGFYKSSVASYAQVGFGTTINGLPTSIPYDSLDYIYKFPMNYGNIDSCKYKFQLSIPSVGYLRRRARRVNEVDGWGTLITPFGSFNTLRVKSTTYATDTIYISQFMFGTQIVQQPTVEYKWIGLNGKIPYLTINASAGANPIISSVVYRDSLRSISSLGNIEKPIIDSKISLYPNPSEGLAMLKIDLNQKEKLTLEVFNCEGKSIHFKAIELMEGGNLLPIDLSAEKNGLYFIRLRGSHFSTTEKFSIFK